MNRYRLFISLIVFLFLLEGCDTPMGGGSSGLLGDIGSSGSPVKLLAVPKRMDYEISEVFNKEEDLAVYINNTTGLITHITIDKVAVALYDDDGAAVPVNPSYAWKTPGRKTVEAKYNNMSTRYDIRVWDPNNLSAGGGTGNLSNGDGSGIDIIWK